MTTNIARIARDHLRLPGAEDVRIIVVDSADSICAPCAYRDGRNCKTQGWAERTDARHAEALDIAPGQVIRWGDLVARVHQRITPDDLDHICAGCPWLPVGMCKEAVARLGTGPLPGGGRSSA